MITPNTEQETAAVQAVKVLVGFFEAAIEDLGQVPSGHLYAAVCGQCSLSDYECIIDLVLAKGRVVRDRSHLLRWVG